MGQFVQVKDGSLVDGDEIHEWPLDQYVLQGVPYQAFAGETMINAIFQLLITLSLGWFIVGPWGWAVFGKVIFFWMVGWQTWTIFWRALVFRGKK